MRRTTIRSAIAFAILMCASSAPALAQDASEKEIERYRAMISDPMSNPGYLAVDRGEVLWSQKRGTKDVSLQTCDLGQGPGKLEGAFAKMPRYFKDADKVMDLEQRLLWCMVNIQGLDTKDVIARRFSGPGRASDMEDLVAFIAGSRGNERDERETSGATQHTVEAGTADGRFHVVAGSVVLNAGCFVSMCAARFENVRLQQGQTPFLTRLQMRVWAPRNAERERSSAAICSR